MVPSSPWRNSAAFAMLAIVTWAGPAPGAAQDPADVRRQLDESQIRLELIREERQQLRRQLDGISGQVSGDSAELVNIERQIAASASVLAEFDIQLRVLTDQVTSMTGEMLRTRDELTARQVVLNGRLRDIYKRGPLRTVEVLLSSRSFSDLLNRYKYLHAVALFDRMLVEQVEDLERRVVDQRSRLSLETDRMALVRAENLREYDELERLERQRQRRLRTFSDRRAEAQSTLARLASEEAQLRGVIATLEERRRAAEREAGAATVSSLTTSDLGRLAWPVEGDILWRFGPERKGRTTIPREGVGIAAERGTPVSAVDRGTVASVVARASGQTVIIDHGGGFYSSYRKLRDVIVREEQEVQSGQVIGRVGGDATNPHIEFQIYEPGALGPRAVDPVRWLRGRP
ncbi:murein hydrolase activator EnvC family protein [Candidatus Palauibacter sp.]|uniref:murein hydrolase activator EnvC family protein n=1 Tax=Candidatus Palauibacter sp. TaxID=3101350 RepID=UPI003AF2D706